jgi:hypothetical protein
MVKKLAVFTFLSFMGVVFPGLHVFAEGPESPMSQMCLASISDIPRFDGKSAPWNDVINGEENALFYSPDTWRADAIAGLASDDADKFDDFNSDDGLGISVVVGLKYIFKSFQLNVLKKSFLSSISNSHKTDQEPERSLEFFLDLP